MEIVYVNDVYQKILDAVIKAEEDGTDIDYISVNEKEMRLILKRINHPRAMYATEGASYDLQFDIPKGIYRVSVMVV